MPAGKHDLPVPAEYRDSRTNKPVMPVLGHALALIASLLLSHQLITMFGVDLFLLFLVGIFLGTLYAVISLKTLLVPFVIWILSLGGFRYIWSIQTPMLPDLFIDRLMMVWLTAVFMVKFFAEKRTLRPPYTLDILVAMHAFYILVRIYLQGMEFIHPWTMSYLIPYGAYFFAKNIVITARQIRIFLWALMAITIYFEITAVAEKTGLDFLVWPKMILTESLYPGRSVGPFMQSGLFGTVIGMLVSLNLYFIATSRSTLLRVGLYFSFALGMAGLYFTYTRGSWLAGILALLTVAFLNARRYGRILLPAVVLLPVVAFSFLGIGQDQFMKERVENENTLGSRVATGLTALKIWRDHPLFGIGFFQYRSVRENYIEPIEVPGLGTIRYIQFRHNNIHDIYLGPLAEDGLIGMGMQFGIYLLILRTFLRKYRWRKDGDYFATYFMPVFGGMFVGYLVGGLAFDYRFFSFVGVLFYMSAGILYGYQRPESQHVS